MDYIVYCALCVENNQQVTRHTHTGHTDRENTPDTGTHTRTTIPPNEHLPQALNNARIIRVRKECLYAFGLAAGCYYDCLLPYTNTIIMHK